MLVIAAIFARRSRIVATASILLIGFGLTAFFTYGFTAGEHLRFLVVRPYYERKLKQTLPEAPNIPYSRDYIVDTGPPVRVAFYWMRGVTDNWIGLVYDPTGEVMHSNKFLRDWSNWDDARLQPVKKLFGGDMTGAKHMGGNWYLCSFT